MEYLMLRLLCALLAGILLSQSGSLIQMSTRNILASPSTLGFDGVSVLWVLLFHSLCLFLEIDPSFEKIFFAGAPFFLFLGVGFALYFEKHQRVDKLILMGLAFSLMVGAVFSLWHFFFMALNLPFPVDLWFGHFRFVQPLTLIFLLSAELLVILGWIYFRKKIRLYSLGFVTHFNLKLNTRALYLFIFVTLALTTFLITCLFGSFSFLGLIFPLLARKFWFRRFDLEGEFFFGAVFNGILLMMVDFFCYQFPPWGAEIPVGLMASIVGAVGLIVLLMKLSNKMEVLANGQK